MGAPAVFQRQPVARIGIIGGEFHHHHIRTRGQNLRQLRHPPVGGLPRRRHHTKRHGPGKAAFQPRSQSLRPVSTRAQAGAQNHDPQGFGGRSETRRRHIPKARRRPFRQPGHTAQHQPRSQQQHPRQHHREHAPRQPHTAAASLGAAASGARAGRIGIDAPIGQELHVAAQDLRGVAGDDAIVRHRFGHHRTGPDDAAVADAHAGQDQRAPADEAVLTDIGMGFQPPGHVMGEDARIESDIGVLRHMDALGVGLVEHRRERHVHAGVNVEPPDPAQIAPLERYQKLAQAAQLVETRNHTRTHFRSGPPRQMLPRRVRGRIPCSRQR